MGRCLRGLARSSRKVLDVTNQLPDSQWLIPYPQFDDNALGHPAHAWSPSMLQVAVIIWLLCDSNSHAKQEI